MSFIKERYCQGPTGIYLVYRSLILFFKTLELKDTCTTEVKMNFLQLNRAYHSKLYKKSAKDKLSRENFFRIIERKS